LRYSKTSVISPYYPFCLAVSVMMVKLKPVILSVMALMAWAQADECPPASCSGEISLMQNLLKVGGRGVPQLELLSEGSASLSGPVLGLLSVESRKEAGNRLLEAAVNMLKNGATPDVVQFVESTTTEITSSVFPSIEDEHQTDQKFINDLLQQFQDVVDQLVQDSERLERLKETRTMDSSTHKQCRFEEGVACAHSRRCEEELEEAWRLVEREEESMRNIHWRITDEWCVHPPTDTIFLDDPFDWDRTRPYPVLDWTQDERDFRRVSAHEFHMYMRQRPIVFAAWAEYNNKIVECANLEAVLESRVTECDDTNTQAESSACNHAEEVRSVRNNFGNAWIHVNQSYWDAVFEIQQLEDDRKREWETLHIVTCLLEAIHTRVDRSVETGDPCPTETSNPEETSEAIHHCHVVAQNLTTHLTIDYGTPPDQPPLPEPPSYPCTPEYIEEEYAGFPVLLQNSYSDAIAGLESHQTVISSYGWPGCAATLVCHTCPGMAADEVNPALDEDAHECKPHEMYLLPGQTDVDAMRCLDGACVPIAGRCNGEPNCADGSDELNCEAGVFTHLQAAFECPHVSDSITFRCGSTLGESSSCVSLPKARCNGYNNCADGSDEENCDCGILYGVTAESTSGRSITVENDFRLASGVFHDRSYELTSLGSFAGKMFIKASNDDKDTEHYHVMWKIRLEDPAHLYLVKLTTQDLPWLIPDGWSVAAGKSGVTYEGTRATRETDWTGHLHPADSYGPGVVYEKIVGAGTTIIPGNGGNDGSFLLFLEKPCDHEIDNVLDNTGDRLTKGNSASVHAGIPDSASSIQFVDVGAGAFEYDGEMVGVSFSVARSNQAGQRFQIYRPISGDQYELVTESDPIASPATGVTVTEIFAHPLPFRAGDFIGWAHRGQGTMPFSGSNNIVRWKYGIEDVGHTISFADEGGRTYSYEVIYTSNELATTMTTTLTKGNNPSLHSGTPDGSSSIQFIDIGAGAFQNDGEMQSVSFAVARADQVGHKFQIYRPTGNNQYELVAESNPIASPEVGGTKHETFASPLLFKAGDYIGWVHTGQGTVPYTRSENNVCFKYGIQGVGSPINFDECGGRTYAYEATFAYH